MVAYPARVSTQSCKVVAGADLQQRIEALRSRVGGAAAVTLGEGTVSAEAGDVGEGGGCGSQVVLGGTLA